VSADESAARNLPPPPPPPMPASWSRRRAMASAPRAYNLLVIGGGSGGIAAARRAAQAGARVALIERTPRLGGTCVNVGCVPKKVMWHAASVAEALHMAPEYGFTGIPAAPSAGHGGDGAPAPWGFDLAALKAARDAYVRRLNDVYAGNMASNGVQVVHGTARIADAHTVEVTSAEVADAASTATATATSTLTADHILLATGSRPRPPPALPGSPAWFKPLTSDDFWGMTAVPRAIAIVGGGYIAGEGQGGGGGAKGHR
jgi:glutathione reductase (NADPH)